MDALLARKKQFDGLKTTLEQYGSAAGPKKQFEAPEPALEQYRGAAGPKEAI
jgi:hypothetical protein